MVDASTDRAAIEWTHHHSRLGRYVRGAEWYLFASDFKITEIRAYYACPAAPGVSHELSLYPYERRGYWRP